MLARDRAILAALGVPLWAQRGLPLRDHAPVALWRDQSPPLVELSSASVVSAPVLVQRTAANTVAATTLPRAMPSTAVSDRLNAPSSTPIQSTQPTQPIAQQTIHKKTQQIQTPQAERATIATVQTRPDSAQTLEPVLRFSVQLRQLGAWWVLLPEQALDDERQAKLWRNICLAFAEPVPQVFIWPLAAGSRWQRNDTAAAALAGFLFAHVGVAQVGLMGELDDRVCPDRLARLPSLAELLAEPLKKRALWQLLTQGS